jgi:hypothetical protein
MLHLSLKGVSRMDLVNKYVTVHVTYKYEAQIEPTYTDEYLESIIVELWTNVITQNVSRQSEDKLFVHAIVSNEPL